MAMNSTYEDRSRPIGRSRNAADLDYTDVEALQGFVTFTGKILPRRITGLSAKQQRCLTKTIKRSRNMLLMK